MLFDLGGPIISTGATKVIMQWLQGQDRGLAAGIYVIATESMVQRL